MDNGEAQTHHTRPILVLQPLLSTQWTMGIEHVLATLAMWPIYEDGALDLFWFWYELVKSKSNNKPNFLSSAITISESIGGKW
jgi:hypothetical protein